MGGIAPSPGSLVERMRTHVRDSLRIRDLPLPDAAVDVLARTCAGWIIAQGQPLLGTPAIPVPPAMYDDVAEAMVQYYAHGLAEPPATKAAYGTKVRFYVSSSLEQLGIGPVPPDAIETLTLLTFGKWHEYELPYMLGVYAREFVGHYLRGAA